MEQQSNLAVSKPPQLINTYDQLKEAVRQGVIKEIEAIYISHYTPDRRDVSPARWQVGSPFFETDPKAHWYDKGKKTFLSLNKYRESLSAAQKWASAKYGITEWARNARGEYVPRVVNKAIPLPKRLK